MVALRLEGVDEHAAMKAVTQNGVKAGIFDFNVGVG